MTPQEIVELLRERIADAWARERKLKAASLDMVATFYCGKRLALESAADEIERRLAQESKL